MVCLFLKNYNSPLLNLLNEGKNKNITLDLDEYFSIDVIFEKLKDQEFSSIVLDFSIDEQSILINHILLSIKDVDMNRTSNFSILIMDLMKKIISKKIISNKPLKVMFLLWDDVFGYFGYKKSSPIFNGLIISMSKSLAKEYSKYNIFFNCFIVQPELKEIDLDKTKKSMLKNFSLKYESVEYFSVINFIKTIIENDFYINGSVFRVGNGVIDHG